MPDGSHAYEVKPPVPLPITSIHLPQRREMVDIVGDGCLIGVVTESVRSFSGPTPCGRKIQAPSQTKRGGARPGSGRKPKPKPIPAPAPQIGPRWCCYRTHPQAENAVAGELARAGYQAYNPLIAVRRRDPVIPSMWHKVRIPVFGGYGFVLLGPTDPWVPIRYTHGVRDMLLGMNGRPATVPAGFVEALQADDARRCDLTPEVHAPLAVGSAVRLTSGAMVDMEGLVTASDGQRVKLLLSVMGHDVAVLCGQDAVEAIECK